MPQDKSEFEELQEKEQGKFNMALDTLKRLSDILIEISRISAEVMIPRNIIQVRKINLVKQFFIQACPLLDKEFKEKYQKRVLDLNPIVVPIRRGGYMETTKTIGYNYQSSFQMDNELDTLIIEIQDSLQLKGYFMPPREEGGLF